jgi:hypothetical protein
MARNELNKDAMKIADLIYKKSSEKTNKEIAEKIGIDPSNLGRFQTNYLEMVCAYLDEIGLSVHVKGESCVIPQDEHKALITLAKKAIEEMGQ